jgi:hypothetical protein
MMKLSIPPCENVLLCPISFCNLYPARLRRS